MTQTNKGILIDITGMDEESYSILSDVREIGMKTGRVSFLIGMLIWVILSATAVAAVPQQVVKQAQQNLQKLGYYNEKIDGIIGRNTQRAVMQYQLGVNIPVTGLLDNTTIEHLSKPTILLNTQNFAPFHYQGIRRGEVDGPVPQIVRLVCREAGINCRIILYDDWRRAQENVKNGLADGMFVIAWNSRRAQWLHRSSALIETEYGLFVRDDDDLQFKEALEQPIIMEGYTVGVYGPSGTSNSLVKLKVAFENKDVTLQINMEADDKPLFEKLSLSKGRFAVYTNRIVAESIIKGLGLSNIRYAGKHRSLSYYVGFSKQRVPLTLVEKFNQAYARMIDQGEIRSIMANHSMYIPKNIKAAPIIAASNKVHTKQRFSLLDLNGKLIVEDGTTCLMWQQSGTQKHCNWGEAVAYVEKLNKDKYAGFSDWRLPVIDELSSLMEEDRLEANRMYIQPIFDSVQQGCWSADKTGMDIRFIDFFDGALGSKDQGDTNFVRAVRGTKCNNKI